MTTQVIIEKITAQQSLQSPKDLGFQNQDALADHLEDQFCEKRRSFLLISGRNGKQVNLKSFLHYCNEKTRERYDAVVKTIPEINIPNCLADFNYEFNGKGELRSLHGEPFHFISQRHYDALGNVIYRHIQDRMVQEYGMKEVFLRTDKEEEKVEEEERDTKNRKVEDGGDTNLEELKHQLVQERLLKNNIFMTKDALENPEKLLVLLQGMGAVRAGQWARALCMNDCLKTGSQFEYIERAIEEGYGVIVLNPNLNRAVKDEVFKEETIDHWTVEGFLNPQAPKPLSDEKTTAIPGHETSDKHVVTVWDEFISKAKAKHIVMVAHSAGGWNSNQLLIHRMDQVLKKLRAIAYTDAAYLLRNSDPVPVKTFITENTINWVASSCPLDEVVGEKTEMRTPECRSAGHEKHEWTSACSIDPVMNFLKSKIEAATDE